MRNSIWVIALLLLAFAGDRLGGWFLGKITQESQFRYSRLYRGKADCDILLVGNSRGLVFFQPHIEEKTGLSTVNLSYNGMPITLASALIKDHLDRHKAPRLLLLDVSLLDKRMDENLVSAFNLYVPYADKLSDLVRDSSTYDYYAGKFSHLYRHNGEVFQRALFYWKKSDKDWLLDRVISPQMEADTEKQDSFLFDFNPKMLTELADVVKYAQQKGVKVELVLNPYYPPFLKRMFNIPQLKSSIETATGLPVRDYSNALSAPSGFGDYQHLNKAGSKLYLDQLIKDGILPVK